MDETKIPTLDEFVKWLEPSKRFKSETLDRALHDASWWIAPELRSEWKASAWVSCLQWQVESPIEAVFLVHWLSRFQRLSSEGKTPTLMMLAQVPVVLEGQSFRFDFVIRPFVDDALEEEVRRKGLWVVVELDGHDFHERTKSQVATRNARDRAIQRAGFQVVHYSGSEVIRNAQACVDDSWDTAIRNGLDDFAIRHPVNPSKV